MTELRIAVRIDDQFYADEQLSRYKYERTLHGLHELKILGADIRDGNHELSHVDINWLEPKRAEQISLDVRASLGEDKMLELFKDILTDTERRWKEFAQGYAKGDVHTAMIEVECTGVNVQEVIAVLGGASSEREALAVMPEHYVVVGNIATGQRGMEAFGLFGEPAYVYGATSDDVVAGMPFEKDPSYPMHIFGEMLLKSDATPIHVGAFHQFRPGANGFAMKSIFFCPKKAPKAIADGHKLHFAIEITNSIKIAYAKKQTAPA